MTVTNVTKDREGCSMTIVAEYDAAASSVWRLWADPRQLERWWGPPTYPATVTEHDLSPGGIVKYHMTGPDGDQHHGGWRVVAAQEPHTIEFEDFFADESGVENSDLPRTKTLVSIRDDGSGGTRMTITSAFPSVEAMDQLLEMGMEEGFKLAVGQTDAVLAEWSA